MTTDEFVQYACTLDSKAWRSLVTTMTWYHKGYRPIAPELCDLEETVSDVVTWAGIKRVISNLRRSNARRSRRHQAVAKKEKRRTYIRHYMRTYRST